MNAVILDTETTGVIEPIEVVQVAWMGVDVRGARLGGVEASQVSMWKPSKMIECGAMATHHIMDEDLVDFPPSSNFKLPAGIEYIIGYKVDYDWKAIGSPDVERIDVCAMCRYLWPKADSHTQGAMLYLLDREHARAMLEKSHHAWYDVLVCQRILVLVLEKLATLDATFDNFDDLFIQSELMRVPTVMSFGKHKGWLIEDVPADYKRWLLKQPDVDEYLRKALEK